jgi:thioredoxin
MKTIEINKEQFLQKVVNYEVNSTEWKYLGDKPAIIDFYASWCGPCKMVAPILEELAEEYGDSIVIYKVNTEKERELSSAFGIRSIPTLIFVPMGENPQVVQGAMGKADFRKVIDEVLLKK